MWCEVPRRRSLSIAERRRKAEIGLASHARSINSRIVGVSVAINRVGFVRAKMSENDTIFALSSGRPPAAIAVIRISGPRAGVALEKLIGRVPPPRRGVFARVRDGAGGEIIDEGLALWFPGPRSETGEDTAELQIHGGRAVIADVLAALGAIDGLRPAEAGEFTRRAFAHGRIDLTAVEGLADLVAAETRAQRRQALRQMQGLLGARAEAWRRALIEAQALVEAGIDFSDEGDVPSDTIGRAAATVRKLAEEIAATLEGARRGERVREGVVIAIAGPPNVGKSTLLNRLARREAAIVAPTAGTTRDVIEVHLDLDGYPVTVLDTAGIRASSDPVEQEGVRRARARAQSADLVLWVVDASAHRRAGESLADRPQGEFHGAKVWIVENKLDLRKHRSAKTESEFENGARYCISALTGESLERLTAAMAGFARDALELGEPALVTRERQRSALATALAALQRAEAQANRGKEDILAEELRSAGAALGRLTGRVDVEDILDVIFRDFCIGK